MRRDETDEARREAGGTCCSGSIPWPAGQAGGPMAMCSQMAGRMVAKMLGAALAVLLLLTGLWVGFSYLEARSFERETGAQVSTWDAMFLDLRVPQESE